MLAPALKHCDMAFVYGSVAKGMEHASSDIDVLLVGEGLSYGENSGAFGTCRKAAWSSD